MEKSICTNEELFLEWLKNKLSQKQISDCYMYCLEIEPVLKKKHWIRASFFEIDSPDVIMQTVKLIDERKNYSSTKKEVFRHIKESLILYLQFLSEKPRAQIKAVNNSPAPLNGNVTSQKSNEVHSAAEGIELEKKAFMQWQRDNGTIEPNVLLYAQAVEKASQLAKQLRCKHADLYCDDPEKTEQTFTELRANAKFNNFNQSKSFIFTRAIKKYIEFQHKRQSEAEEERQISKIGWNKYEAAILLDGCIEIISDESCRNEVIKRISKDLRQMAINNGIEIDEIYRNVNGIHFQMKSMESAFWGKTIVKPSTALFREVTALYQMNRTEYDALLAEAKRMIAGNTTSSESVCPGTVDHVAKRARAYGGFCRRNASNSYP